MHHRQNRREFLQQATAASVGLASVGRIPFAWAGTAKKDPLFKISLAEYSLHRTVNGGKLKHLDVPQTIKREFDISAIEYSNGMWQGAATDEKYVSALKRRCEDHGVRSLLIMVDREGDLGDPDEAARKEAIQNHRKWLEAAKTLGCHSIRVNAHSKGTFAEQQKLVADGLSRLSEAADPYELNVIVENHGGLSSNGKWLAGVMKMVGRDNCGTLPDFGNFDGYDRYMGTKELMPWAKAVSAKTEDFDDRGNETHTDYFKIMKIVLDAGYRGYVGIEYNGKKTGEREGIGLTKRLLLRVMEWYPTE